MLSKRYLKNMARNFLMMLVAFALIFASGIRIGNSAEVAIHCWNSTIGGELTTTRLTVTITTAHTLVEFLESRGLEDTAIPIQSNITQDGCPANLIITAPDGWVFSTGTQVQNQWTIPVGDLQGLTVTPPPDWNGAADFPIELVYRSPPV